MEFCDIKEWNQVISQGHPFSATSTYLSELCTPIKQVDLSSWDSEGLLIEELGIHDKIL